MFADFFDVLFDMFLVDLGSILKSSAAMFQLQSSVSRTCHARVEEGDSGHIE